MFEVLASALFGPVLFLFPELRASMVDAWRNAFQSGYVTTAVTICFAVAAICLLLALILGLRDSHRG